MDIPGIDLVVVYDLPSSLTQVYIIFHKKCDIIYYFQALWSSWTFWKQCEGSSFFAHKKDYKDKRLQEYVECGENCRREILVRGMGGMFSNSNGVSVLRCVYT